MIGRKTPSQQEVSAPQGFDAFELRLGDIMRGERATLGKSLIDVQRELKIKATYIAAIENADSSAFDTPGFIAGYVRSYARYLGLDPEWAWETFCAEAGFQMPEGLSAPRPAPRSVPRRSALDPLADPKAPFVPRGESWLSHIELRAVGSLMVLASLIGAIGYGGWSVLQQVQRVQIAPVDQAPGVVADLPAFRAPVAPEAPGVSAAPLLADLAGPSVADRLDRLYRPPALDVPVLVARDGPIAAVDPDTTGVLARAPGEALATERLAALDVPSVAPQVEPPPPQVVAEAAAELRLIAVRPAWVRVTAADGTVLLEKILEAGESWAVPATEEPPILRAGNSGAVYFAVNGDTYGPAAPGSQVVKQVALSPESLAASYQVADMGADPDLAAYAVAQAAAGATEAAVKTD